MDNYNFDIQEELKKLPASPGVYIMHDEKDNIIYVGKAISLKNSCLLYTSAMRVSIVSIVVNVILSVFKLLAGLLAGSGAMVSDAIHSASDVFSTVIVMIGVTISGKKSDKEHPYGHDRMECVASILLAVVLFATGLGIGVSGIEKIAGGGMESAAAPGRLALAAAVDVYKRQTQHYWRKRWTACSTK